MKNPNKHSRSSRRSLRSQRPWGHYVKFFEESGVWVKRVEVNPQSRLSLQKHEHRSEKWIFVTGQGLAIVNDQKIPVQAGSIVDIPLGAVHRIGNPSRSEGLVFIEVACGNFLSEDDIIRLQDDYSRVDNGGRQRKKGPQAKRKKS
jgi:mannose-6-phosphate isomerase-like protein (cupin superfamily)